MIASLNCIPLLNVRYENKNEADSTCWFENELKAFHWFLVVLSGLR